MSSHSHQRTPESQIRLRLLNRLGIHKAEPSRSDTIEHRRKHTLYYANGNGSCVGHRTPIPFCQPLKDYYHNHSSDNNADDHEEDDGHSDDLITSPSTFATPYQTSLDDNDKDKYLTRPPLQQQNKQQQQKHDRQEESSLYYDRSNRRRKIQFNNNVMVVPIPSRHAYSKRIKQAFWMDGAEIQATAERNRYEFASEGWDYHQVLEDDDMYVDTTTGQLVHPCWVEDEEYDDDDNEDDGDDDSDHYNLNVVHGNGILDEPPKLDGQCSDQMPSMETEKMKIMEKQADSVEP